MRFEGSSKVIVVSTDNEHQIRMQPRQNEKFALKAFTPHASSERQGSHKENFTQRLAFKGATFFRSCLLSKPQFVCLSSYVCFRAKASLVILSVSLQNWICVEIHETLLLLLNKLQLYSLVQFLWHIFDISIFFHISDTFHIFAFHHLETFYADRMCKCS